MVLSDRDSQVINDQRLMTNFQVTPSPARALHMGGGRRLAHSAACYSLDGLTQQH